eukprot:TRINITY_DN4684_c0_g3_i1.p1 TRINITY_DN4684_c0_g3~~TRINITY_DN4684_c0_g3_i1.p1  ORF type:complete len:233 (-),score=-29.96 TRINITY_DN4684_c0_g3_i1:490-1188(-)
MLSFSQPTQTHQRCYWIFLVFSYTHGTILQCSTYLQINTSLKDQIIYQTLILRCQHKVYGMYTATDIHDILDCISYVITMIIIVVKSYTCINQNGTKCSIHGKHNFVKNHFVCNIPIPNTYLQHVIKWRMTSSLDIFSGIFILGKKFYYNYIDNFTVIIYLSIIIVYNLPKSLIKTPKTLSDDPCQAVIRYFPRYIDIWEKIFLILMQLLVAIIQSLFQLYPLLRTPIWKTP